MARETLAVQSTARTGLVASYTAATADGHAFDNSTQNVFLHVKNGSGVSTTVTIDMPKTVDGLAVPDRTVTVAAGAHTIIGPFSRDIYNQVSTTPAITEAVLVNASPTTSITYAAIKPGSV